MTFRFIFILNSQGLLREGARPFPDAISGSLLFSHKQ
uniref:Uncharacterized protein n=1 Tax=Siphoviridae sp. cthrK8 TaxID=2826429 RepID=A0A8S5MZJ5_9CAUD|nr:MAG TPA: hypothetical protein [Siphoviridae sp. cthrK8]